MLAKKQKRNPPDSKPSFKMPSAAEWKGQAFEAVNRAMRRLFGLPEDWYKERDIAKNNYELGVKYLRSQHENDAVLRLRLATWANPRHADAWHYLGRAALASGKRGMGVKALEKAASLSHPAAATLLSIVKEEKFTVSAREASASDAGTLSGLHRDAFLKYWSEQEIAGMFAPQGTEGWVAGTSDLPMGMLMSRALGEQYEILTTVVSPEWRRRGIGRLLMHRAIASAKASGAKTLFLEVAENNLAARRLYEAEGFTLQSRREGYYRQEDGGFADALVMRLELA